MSRIRLFCACLLLFQFPPSPGLTRPARAAENQASPRLSEGSKSPEGASRPWWSSVRTEWSGQMDTIGMVSWADGRTFFEPVGTGTLYDGLGALRLINENSLSDWGYFEAHYQMILRGGDTFRKKRELQSLFPDLPNEIFFPAASLEDDARLMDLTRAIREDDDLIWFHRLDRLSFTWRPEWGSLGIGRQALTWGNGLIFNPMDLFNPFAPTDIKRDYKVGDDMITSQVIIPGFGDFQALYVARRDPQSGDAGWDEASVAGKLHLALGTTELDLLGAKHYQDHVLGVGSRGYLGDAAWRLDATWTMLRDPSGQSPKNYLSLVANMDYSWTWWGRNFYGLVEYYHNGLGERDPAKALTNPDIMERLRRGELFVLERNYLSSMIQVEIHPLVNLFVTLITNIQDPSGIIQPRAVWNVTQDLELKFGFNLSFGSQGTEFGGFLFPGTDIRSRSPDNTFLWFTYYF